MTYKEYCKNELGYEVITTYFDDLAIAEHFGTKAIKDTVKNAIKHDKDYKNLTELVMVINHRCWLWHEKNNELSDFYADLYYATKDIVLDMFNDKEKIYFFEMTD